jgi:4-amino-4-deoxy-L-arabinose transferase-like glycosyltransferase
MDSGQDKWVGQALFRPVSTTKESYLYPFFLSLLAVLLFFPGLGARDFWAPGEPIYGEIIRVMFDKREWVVPTVNGQLYTDKPILYFWLALVFSKMVGGVSEWTTRLPSALGGLGLVLTTYCLGKTFYDRQTGFLSGLLLATSSRVVWESRFLRLDTVLSFFLFLGFYLFLKIFIVGGPSALYLVAYLCFALATLTKGPVGLVLPGLTALGLLLLTRRWRELRNMHLISGAFLVAAVIIPWLLLLHVKGEDQWLRDFIWIHNIQNYALRPIGHIRPVYYYLWNLPSDFLPWTILLPAALLYYYPWRDRLRQPVTLALFCLFAVIFIFFSASKSKIAYYLLPLLPSLALFAGSYLNNFFLEKESQGIHRKCTVLLLYVLAASMLVGGIALPFASYRLEPDLFLWALAAASILSIGSGGMILLLGRKKLELFFLVLIAVFASAIWISDVGLLPYLDRYKSPRAMGEFIQNKISAKAPVYIYRDTMSDFNYYARRETIPVLRSVEDIEQVFLKGQEAYLLISERHLNEFPLGRPQTIVTERQLGETKWYLARLSGSSQ